MLLCVLKSNISIYHFNISSLQHLSLYPAVSQRFGIWIKQMKFLKILGLVGASLALLGSFLPWEQAGDVISYRTYGIQFFPIVNDNGGWLVVILTLTIILLSFKPPRFIRDPGLWNLIISALLMTTSIIYIARWTVHRFESTGPIGAATLGIGLLCVVVGSALLLWVAIVN
jgi:hypothetical protein